MVSGLEDPGGSQKVFKGITYVPAKAGIAGNICGDNCTHIFPTRVALPGIYVMMVILWDSITYCLQGHFCSFGTIVVWFLRNLAPL